MDIVINFLKEILNLWLDVSPYLILGMTIAGIVHVFLGKEFVSRHLGRGGIGSILKATLIGVPLPVCSCGVIPLATSLRNDGAHKSSVLAFLVATPATGIDSIMVTYSLLGPLFAVFKVVGAFISGITLGIIDFWVEGRKENLIPVPHHTHIKISHGFKLKEFIKYAFFEIPRDIGKWLFIGIVFGAAISVVVPEDFLANHISFPGDFLAALLIGTPLYVCATGSIPIAASLIEKGISPGAAMVFLIAGPATNTLTMAFVRAKLGRKSFYLYIFNIIITALVMGLFLNYIWRVLGAKSEFLQAGGRMLPVTVKVAAGIILFSLIINSFGKKKECVIEAEVDLAIEVKDIHCQHCRIVLLDKLHDLEGIEELQIDVDRKQIKIRGKAAKEEIFKKIKEAGYTPREIIRKNAF